MDRTPIQIMGWMLAALLVAAEGQAQEPLPAPKEPPARLSLDDLTNMALQQNPRLQRLSFTIEATRGRAIQAGLYPNPQLRVSGEELGGRQGPGGVITGPFVSQEIVTAGKLKLSRAVLEREVDQATLGLMSERYVLLATVRRDYFDVLTVQRRAEILDQLVSLSSKSVETAQRLVEAKEVAELDLIQFRVERNRFRAEREANQRELTAAFRRMAANLGFPDLPPTPLEDLLTLPDPVYEFEPARSLVASVHPQLRSAQVGVSRAQVALRRAEAEPIPNVSFGAGYVRNNKDRADEWAFQVGIPIPVFNRNQGNIRAAQAEIGQASRQVNETENELIGRLATAFGDYAAARERVDQYRTDILPDAQRAYQLSIQAFQGGEFQYLRVLQAQRTVAETNLEYVRALGEMWKAASDISGLLLEENWPFIQSDVPAAPTR
jgi:cobalt-zinc-cadmium efflux system outer membrane protein